MNTTRNSLEEINIQGLQPSTKYQFRVVAYNEHGPGDSSDEFTVETQGEGKIIKRYEKIFKLPQLLMI